MAKKDKNVFSKELKLMKVTRTETFVRYKHEVSITNGTDMHDITAHEAPKKSFDKALQSLAIVACKVLGVRRLTSIIKPVDWRTTTSTGKLFLRFAGAAMTWCTVGRDGRGKMDG